MGCEGLKESRVEERREEERRTISCAPDTCQYHILTESIIHDLKDATEKLMQGQNELSKSVTQLVEGFKFMDKLDGKVDRLESEMKEKDDRQDIKIDKLKGFMYKVTGIAVGISAICGILVPILVVVI